jgi:hypothetical protein
MTLAFTICSINYLAQAKTLGNSLKETNPDWQFVIGLVDKLDKVNIAPQHYPVFEMLEIDKIGIPNFEQMCQNYDITELNTAVKPFFISHFFEQKPNLDNVIYFDPDIIIYQKLTELENDLSNHNIVVTPHMTQPIDDDYSPTEEIHLKTGVFNLGFVAMSRSAETLNFVSWWQRRLSDECIIDLPNGLFVDQNWMNFAPFYCDKVLVNRHLGYNVAYWNLHERFVSVSDNTIFINQDSPLRFFHFSGYGLAKPNNVSKYQNRITFEQRPDIEPLFRDYAQRLTDNGNEYFIKIPCFYIKPAPVVYYKSLRNILKKPFEVLINWLKFDETTHPQLVIRNRRTFFPKSRT